MMAAIASPKATLGLEGQPMLELRDVSGTFAVRKSAFAKRRVLRAVDEVSLRVERGEVLGIVGESGCGKSTLARIMQGLLVPTAGEILVNGQPIGGFDRRALARQVQPVFQDPYSSLNPRKTVASIIAMPLSVHAIGSSIERGHRVRELMAQVGLADDLRHSYPSQLSSGQRQRVAIARALAIRPRMMILDEPTSALDVSVQAQILHLLRTLRKDLGLTYVFISHDLSVIDHMADRVAVMYLGRIVELGPTRRVLEAPRHPYTRALLAALLVPDASLGLPTLNLGRGFPDPFDPPPGCVFHPRCPDAGSRCRVERPALGWVGDGGVACHLHPPDGAAERTSMEVTR
jgi:peptide/nickel transport system ATP-binding protein